MKSIKWIALVVLVAVASSCGSKKDSKAEKTAQLEAFKKQAADLQIKIKKLEDELRDSSNDNNKLVTVDSIKQTTFKHYLEIQGKIDADQNVTISAKSPGPITAINVKEGDIVKKGQVLAVIDNQITVQSIEELKSQLAFATTLFEKQKVLWDKKIGSEVQYLNAKNNKESLEKKLATLNEQLDLSRIKSPIDGVVDEVQARIGQNAAPGVPAFRIVNLSNLKVKVDVPEGYSDKVNNGDEAIITIPDLKKDIAARVSYTSRVINAASRTFYVEANLEARPEYRPNMLALLKIVDYKADKAMVVPVNVIQKAGSTSYVMVAVTDGGKTVARKLTVTTGQVYGGQAEITKGLKAGDRIITAGYQDLNDGDLLKL